MSNFVLYELRYNWPTKTAQFRIEKLKIGGWIEIVDCILHSLNS